MISDLLGSYVKNSLLNNYFRAILRVARSLFNIFKQLFSEFLNDRDWFCVTNVLPVAITQARPNNEFMFILWKLIHNIEKVYKFWNCFKSCQFLVIQCSYIRNIHSFSPCLYQSNLGKISFVQILALGRWTCSSKQRFWMKSNYFSGYKHYHIKICEYSQWIFMKHFIYIQNTWGLNIFFEFRIWSFTFTDINRRRSENIKKHVSRKNNANRIIGMVTKRSLPYKKLYWRKKWSHSLDGSNTIS